VAAHGIVPRIARFDFARIGTNIAKMLAGSVALLTVANCEPSDGLFATATFGLCIWDTTIYPALAASFNHSDTR